MSLFSVPCVCWIWSYWLLIEDRFGLWPLILKIRLFVFCLFTDVCLLDVTYRPESCTQTGAWVLGRCSACRSWTAQSCKSDSAACSPYQSRIDFCSCAVPGHCAARKPWSVRCGSPARAAPPPSSRHRNPQIPPESNLHPAPNLTPNQTQRSDSLSRARETSPALPSSLSVRSLTQSGIWFLRQTLGALCR